MLVGLPILGLFGLLDVGRGIAAPPSVGGDWIVDFDPAPTCLSGSALRQPALNIAQSGTDAVITLNDGHASALPAALNGATLTAAGLTATVSGKPGQRTLAGTLQLAGCPPLPFHAVRQAPPKKTGE